MRVRAWWHGRAGVGLAIGVLAVSVSACSSPSKSSNSNSNSPSGTPIEVDAIADLSGTYGQFGTEGLNGIKAQIAVINAHGGVLGRPLKLNFLDDQSSATVAASAAQQLVNATGGQTAIMVEAGSVPTTTEAILPVTTSAKFITISPSTLPTLDNPATYPYNYGAYPSQANQVPGVLAAIRKVLGSSKDVAVVNGSDVGAMTVGNALATAFTSAGLNVVAHESVSETSTDDTVALQKAKSAGAAALFLELLSPSAYVTAMEGIQQLGWTTVHVLANGSAVTSAVFGAIPSAVQSQFSAVAERVNSTAAHSTQLTAFINELKKSGPIASLGISANYADQLNLAVWAIKKAGSATNVAKLTAALNSLHKTTLPSDLMLALPNPQWSATVRDFSNADLGNFWGLIKVGTAVNGQYPGQPVSY